MPPKAKRKHNIPIGESHSPFARSEVLGPTAIPGRKVRARRKINKYKCRSLGKSTTTKYGILKDVYVQECTWTNARGKVKKKIVKTPVEYRRKYNKEYWLYLKKVGPKFPQPQGAKPRVIRKGTPKPR
jgi:hypothetical protein